MALRHRQRDAERNNDGTYSSEGDVDAQGLKSNIASIAQSSLIYVLALVTILSIAYAKWPVGNFKTISVVQLKSRSSSTHAHLDGQLSGEAVVSFSLLRVQESEEEETEKEARLALGPHQVQVTIKSSNCKFPRFWIRLVGDALVAITLQQDAGNNRLWEGTFMSPVAGAFQVDARWYGCSETDLEWMPMVQPIKFELTGKAAIASTATTTLTESLFPSSAWMRTKTKMAEDTSKQYNYMWRDPLRAERTLLKTKNNAVVIESAATAQHGFYKFSELGNYELLCWVGGNITMEATWRYFLELRPSLFKTQRPFKFHMYTIADLVKPDREWTTDLKKRFRKCKHMLVSFEEQSPPVSQVVYKEQITVFLKHLLKLMNDDTFPIRVFTWSEPPMNATNCHTPFLARTTDHPCNDVLRELFQPASPTFPPRVTLVDNTDLSLPQFGENRGSILTNIALRIFVLAGKQVSDWRQMGQIGKVDGLHRNGKVEPNFELIPYDWDS